MLRCLLKKSVFGNWSLYKLKTLMTISAGTHEPPKGTHRQQNCGKSGKNCHDSIGYDIVYNEWSCMDAMNAIITTIYSIAFRHA